jgi:hypothetical protein
MSEITSSFPHSAFTPLNCTTKGKPDHAALTILEKEVFENARAIYSPLGTGTHGHLFLVVDGPRYCTLTGAAVAPIRPVNPGVHPNLGGTAQQIAQADRIHKDEVKQFQTCTVVDANLKKLILEAVPPTYLEELADTVMGFANVTCLEILQHLRTTYGTVTPDDLKTNLKNLTRQWNPDQPLTDLWSQIKICQDFAAPSAEPISNATIIRLTLDNLEESGVFTYDIRDWRKLDPVQHTIANLKRHFNTADTERIRLLSSKSGGYAKLADLTNVAHKAAQPASAADFVCSQQYCWSHGLITTPNENPHNSKTCKYRFPGHCEEATLLNTMGGCNLIRTKSRMTWKRPDRPDRPASNAPNPA